MCTILKVCISLLVLSLLACELPFVSSKVNIVIFRRKLSPPAKQSKPQVLPSCTEDEILITKKITKPKCFPKVEKLYENCTRNEQCTVKHSYCGIYEISRNQDDDEFESDPTLCLCNDGYKSVWNNTFCFPQCRPAFLNDNSLNDNSTILNCPESNQICHKEDGFCYCQDGFSFNRHGKCVPFPTSKWIIYGTAAALGVLVGAALGTALGFLIYFSMICIRKNRKSTTKNRKARIEDAEVDELDGIAVQQPTDKYCTHL